MTIIKGSNSFFTASMKLADILLTNYSLLTVLPRFEIQLGFGDKSLSDVCKQYNVNEVFFLLVCNVYTFDSYLPERKTLSTLEVASLIEYLQRSHHYYINDRIFKLENKLDSMGAFCSEAHHRIIQSFFYEYKQELIRHFRYEDTIVFPYIKSLINGDLNSMFHIHQYEENHSNIEDKLSDLKNIILKYLPESCSSSERISVLVKIFDFETELSKHSLIEDKILIPFVQEIEKNYEC